MAMNKQRRTSNFNNIILYDEPGNVTIPQIANATLDTDKFIVSDNGTIKYRTGSQLISDILTLTTNNSTGPATLVGTTLNIPDYSTMGFVPSSRTLTINGTTYDLSANRTWTLTTSNISEGTNLYFTNSRARTAITLTTNGTSGAATYNSSTGVLNIPNYQTGPSGNFVTLDTNQTITAPKTFQPTTGPILFWGNIYKPGFLCTTGSTGLTYWQNFTTGKTWDLEFVGDNLVFNESNVAPRLKLVAGGGVVSDYEIYSGTRFKTQGNVEFTANTTGLESTANTHTFYSTGGTGWVSNVNITAPAFPISSDIRLKNIIERNPAVSLDVELVKYTLKDSNLVRYGYIAQDVKSLIPELVFGDDLLSLNYTDVHSIKIAALEKKVKELEAKLATS